MAGDLAGKYAIVTGATSGIGLETAAALAGNSALRRPLGDSISAWALWLRTAALYYYAACFS